VSNLIVPTQIFMSFLAPMNARAEIELLIAQMIPIILNVDMCIGPLRSH
jgi:hypothetical protein